MSTCTEEKAVVPHAQFPQPLVYPAQFRSEDGAILVTFRDVPEAITQGGTFEEAVLLAQDALFNGLSFYPENGKPYPKVARVESGDVLIAAIEGEEIPNIEALEREAEGG